MKDLSILWAVLLLIGVACHHPVPEPTPPKPHSVETEPLEPDSVKHLIVVSIDGPRYSETWGEASQSYIPHLSQELAPQGVLYTSFYNDGLTLTISGHTALMTGVYEALNNEGVQSPSSPSWMQHWLKKTGKPASKAYMITGKRKMKVLADCTSPEWHNQFTPSWDARNRSDSSTFETALKILTEDMPDLAFIHFRDVDVRGHAYDWEGYLAAIRQADVYVSKLWSFLNSHEYYKGQTALWITHDHGRHLDGVVDGYANHGDDCDGCRRISLLALGPGLSPGKRVKLPADLSDIFPTIAAIFDLPVDAGQGSPLTDLLPKE